MRKVTSFPHNCPTQKQMMCWCRKNLLHLKNIGLFLELQKKPTTQPPKNPKPPKQPTINYSHAQEPLKDGFTHCYLPRSSQLYTDLHLFVYGSDYDPAVNITRQSLRGNEVQNVERRPNSPVPHGI